MPPPTAYTLVALVPQKFRRARPEVSEGGVSLVQVAPWANELSEKMAAAMTLAAAEYVKVSFMSYLLGLDWIKTGRCPATRGLIMNGMMGNLGKRGQASNC